MKRSGLFIVAAFLAPASGLHAETEFDGRWNGAIDVPSGALEIQVDLASSDDGVVSGDISIPVQSLIDIGLEDVTTENRSIQFSIPDIPGEPKFDGRLDETGETIAGTFTQGGNSLPFSLARENVAEQAAAAIAGLEAEIDQALGDFNVPGMGIAIVAGDEIVYAQGFGRRHLDEELPMTPDSLFPIGSTTKAMTATVLGMLSDDGLVDLDAPVRRYLPAFNLSDPGIAARITPRDLITHRSGLPRHDLLWYNYNEGTRADLIARFEHLEFTADLRERYQYNNLMYMTAGYLAGQLGGSTWEEVVRSRLFEPLGMTRSNFSVADTEADSNHARPHRETDDDQLESIPFRSLDLIGPAGSVNSTVNEMAQWLRFNLSGGLSGGERLINAATLADIHSPHMTLPAQPAREEVVSAGYGLGWNISVYRGHRRLAHSGGIDGFITYVALFPDDDLGLVAFTNSASPLANLFSMVAADRILGLEPIDWVGEALERREIGKQTRDEAEEKLAAVRNTRTEPSHPLVSYPGTYQHPSYGTLTIGAGRRDVLEVTYNGIQAPLEHLHYNVWSGAEADEDKTFEDVMFLFRMDFDGEITSVEVPLEPTASPIAFEKQPDPKLSEPDYLQRFIGNYENAFGATQRVSLSGNQLQLVLPGQPVYKLVPMVSGRFAIDGLQGFSVGFSEDDGEVTGITYYQPNGIFSSERQPDGD